MFEYGGMGRSTACAGGEVGVGAGLIVSVTEFVPPKILVPLPSLAKICAFERVTFALPTAFALKVTLKIFADFPRNPSENMTPAKEILPVALLITGSSTQKFIRDDPLDIETAVTKSLGKFRIPDAAFIEIVGEEAVTVTVKLSFTLTAACVVARLKVASPAAYVV
mgnify:CR=1 FL=1